MRKSLFVLTTLAVAMLLTANSTFAVIVSPLNGGFENPTPPSPPFGTAPTGEWTSSCRTDTGLDNWDLNNTIELDTGLYSSLKWRYGGGWSCYAEETGDALLGLNTKHDYALFGGVQQDLGTMDNAGDVYTLDATVYGHVHSDQNTVWGTAWENCDAALYQFMFYNVTEGVVLSSITEADFKVGYKGGYVPAGDTLAPEVVAVTMEYTAQASDVGDVLRLLLLPRNPGAGLLSHVGVDNVTVGTTAVPEPSTCAMLMIGLLSLAFVAHRRK